MTAGGTRCARRRDAPILPGRSRHIDYIDDLRVPGALPTEAVRSLHAEVDALTPLEATDVRMPACRCRGGAPSGRPRRRTDRGPSR